MNLKDKLLACLAQQGHIKMKWDNLNVNYVKRDQCKIMKAKKVVYYVQWGNIKIVNSKPTVLIVVVYKKIVKVYMCFIYHLTKTIIKNNLLNFFIQIIVIFILLNT